jgi:hypothetical protein
MFQETIEIMRVERDTKLDICIAHIREIEHPLETEVAPLFDGNVLFKVDSVTGELVQIFIYDFSVFRRKLFTSFIFLYTSLAIKNWLQTLIAGFGAGRHANRFIHS